ncbi:unnamed protein product [Paramecium octaurelia]|uniref:Uncharacterized protein n=1 Tax=Paramecium octaurelia TaxID=43137 RepID=A0A8S1W322_PAROT|nr:unnamed protein product [Paramecium octaurelia]
MLVINIISLYSVLVINFEQQTHNQMLSKIYYYYHLEGMVMNNKQNITLLLIILLIKVNHQADQEEVMEF